MGFFSVTCGGKTTVANYLKGQLPKDSLAVIHQDDYYWVSIQEASVSSWCFFILLAQKGI